MVVKCLWSFTLRKGKGLGSCLRSSVNVLKSAELK